MNNAMLVDGNIWEYDETSKTRRLYEKEFEINVEDEIDLEVAKCHADGRLFLEQYREIPRMVNPVYGCELSVNEVLKLCANENGDFI
jgi:hypothetical protein